MDWKEACAQADQAKAQGRLPEAERLYQFAIQELERLRPPEGNLHAALYRLAIIYLEQQQYAEGERTLKHLLSLSSETDPETADVHCLLGASYYEWGKYREAASTFEKAFTLYSTSQNLAGATAVFNNLGHAYRQLGCLEKMDAYYETLRAKLQTAYGANDARLADIHSYMGYFYYEDGQYKKAVPYYKEALFSYELARDLRNVAGLFNNLVEMYNLQHRLRLLGELDGLLDRVLSFYVAETQAAPPEITSMLRHTAERYAQGTLFTQADRLENLADRLAVAHQTR